MNTLVNELKPITLTPSAAEHISNELSKSQESDSSILGLKLSIKVSGCSGYSYVLGWIKSDSPDIEKQHKFTSHGIDIYVDDKSYLVIAGTQVDYVQQGISQVMVFRNPNATAECGCGESFTIEQDKM